ncbi:mitochondrial ribosomal small subunit component [Malassezia yamatoensis]|uniref:Small ribosomal subunit protein mS23 n=1 Tax=Malassezia yamatoensis TaxID=253288 RepID=A0AAJ5YPE6_9BASI|nr:mitochondrial ribosomal small subunit component [Malassezia yamatoensis]
MPRRIPIQVTQTVSRLLEGGYLKKPPAWYETTLRHPPALVPPRQSRERPDSDLPRSLQSDTRRNVALQDRSQLNTRKKLRSQLPPLRPQPIVYDSDRIRRQFFRDHPWEAKRVSTLVEMDYELEASPEPTIPSGETPELFHWNRLNPSVEDVIQCTLRTSQETELSLSQAYRRTIAAYHAIQAEREHRIRYATYEARSLGADLGRSETERGFVKEQRELDKWASVARKDATTLQTDQPVAAGKLARKKRIGGSFTDGQAYLKTASDVSSGQTSSPPAPSAPERAADATESDNFLGVANALR